MERNLNCTSALIIRENQVLLGERKKKEGASDWDTFWYTRGGRCYEGETPEACLVREVSEEIGVSDPSIKSFLAQYPGALEDEHGRDTVFAYLLSISEEPRLMEPEKFLQWKWFSINELPENLLNRKKAIEMIELAFSEAAKLLP